MLSRYETPYLGTNNLNYLQNLRVGVVTKYNNELVLDEEKHYNTVNIQWIDGQIYSQNFVPIAKTMSSDGCGIFVAPSNGDFAVAHFRQGSNPIILGFLDRNSYLQAGSQEKSGQNNDDAKQVLNSDGDVKAKDDTKNSFVPLRRLLSGEVYIKSKNQAEIFLNDKGMLQFITRQAFDTTNNIPLRATEMLSGVKLYAEDGITELLDDNGKSLNFLLKQNQIDSSISMNSEGEIKVKTISGNVVLDCNGNKLTLDKSGTVTLENQSGMKIVINGSSIEIGENASSPVPLGDKLLTFLTSFVGNFNLHTHISSVPGNPTTTPLPVQLAPSNILSTKINVE